MYNYTTTAIALLVRMNLLTEDAAKELSDKLASAIHAARFQDNYEVVDQVLKDFEDKDKKVLVEPWMSKIRALEAKIEKLDSEVKSLKPKKK